MTPYEFTMLCEHHKQMKKDDYEILRNTIFNAGANLLRSEGEKEIPLFDDINKDEEETDKQKLQRERDALFNGFYNK